MLLPTRTHEKIDEDRNNERKHVTVIARSFLKITLFKHLR